MPLSNKMQKNNLFNHRKIRSDGYFYDMSSILIKLLIEYTGFAYERSEENDCQMQQIFFDLH